MPASSFNQILLGTTNSDLSLPAGIIVDFAGSSAPSGWLLCYGQAVSRNTYAALFAAISTSYGIGDGATTFNLPDCRGRVKAGKDDMGGSAASRIAAGTSLGYTAGSETLPTGVEQQDSPGTALAGSGTNLQPTIIVNTIIKY